MSSSIQPIQHDFRDERSLDCCPNCFSAGIRLYELAVETFRGAIASCFTPVPPPIVTINASLIVGISRLPLLVRNSPEN